MCAAQSSRGRRPRFPAGLGVRCFVAQRFLLGEFVTGSWGDPGVPVLPAALRRAWASEELPGALVSEIRNPLLQTWADLDAQALAAGQLLNAKARGIVARLLTQRQQQIGDHPAVAAGSSEVPVDLLPWSSRTRNLIQREIAARRLSPDARDWASLRIRDVLAIPNAGVKVFLDFACVLEAFWEQADQSRAFREHLIRRGSLAPISVEPWMAEVGAFDQRFADLLPPRCGSLGQLVEDHNRGAPNGNGHVASGIDEIVHGVRCRADAIAAEPLELALTRYVGGVCRLEGVRRDAVLARLGLSGRAHPVLLIDAAAKMGVTRERARQITERTLRARPARRAFLPQLEAALSLLAESAPITTAKAARVLVERGIAGTMFHPNSLLAAADFAYHEHDLVVEEIDGHELVISGHAVRLARVITHLMAEQAAQYGVFGPLTIAAAVPGGSADEAVLTYARRLPKALMVYAELAEGWQWRPSNPDSEVSRYAAQALTRDPEIALRTICEGFTLEAAACKARSGAPATIATQPPIEAFRLYFAVHHKFRLNGEKLRLVVN